MPKVVLDAEAFKVLASDTRLSILKGLDGRPKTVSELARELDLNKATVFEHLKSLMAGDLVKKQEREGRKWVYYTLSWKGKSLLHPENTTVMVLLGMGLMGSTAALLQLGNLLRWWGLSYLAGPVSEEDGKTEEGGQALDDPQSADEGSAGAQSADDTSGGSDTADAAGDTEAFRQAEGEDAAAQDGGGGGFLDLVDDSAFWWFALFLLIGTTALVAAGVIRYRARREGNDALDL